MRVATFAIVALLLAVQTAQAAPTSASNCVSSDRTLTVLCAQATASYAGHSCDGDGNCVVHYGVSITFGGGAGACALDTTSGVSVCSDPANPSRTVEAYGVASSEAGRGVWLTVHSQLCIGDPLAGTRARCQSWTYPQTYVG